MTRPTLLRSVGLACATIALSGCLVSATYSDRPAPPPLPPPAAPQAAVSVNVGFFYDALDPDGDWLWNDPYGWVWAPRAVAPFWRPYTVGRWEWTDWGWTWVSTERWGWATDHYGRWVRVNHHGWVWVPGDVWGPAWVAWRYGPGVVGWAPLPPEARFREGYGLDWGGIDIDVAIHLDTWCFVDDVRFADADVRRYAYPVGRNTTVYRGTRDATRMRVYDGRIVNEGIDRVEIERATQRAIPMRRVVDKPGSNGRVTEVATDQVKFFRPDVRPGSSDAAPPRGGKPAEPARPSPSPQVEKEAERRWDRGWNKDWDKLEKLQRRDEPAKANPPARARPRPENLEKVRDENMAAAENAYRELVAERDRAKRQATRGPQKSTVKKSDKSGEEKDKK
jgi:hypothetical protein